MPSSQPYGALHLHQSSSATGSEEDAALANAIFGDSSDEDLQSDDHQSQEVPARFRVVQITTGAPALLTGAPAQQPAALAAAAPVAPGINALSLSQIKREERAEGPATSAAAAPHPANSSRVIHADLVSAARRAPPYGP
jgi:hypothetical protein